MAHRGRGRPRLPAGEKEVGYGFTVTPSLMQQFDAVNPNITRSRKLRMLIQAAIAYPDVFKAAAIRAAFPNPDLKGPPEPFTVEEVRVLKKFARLLKGGTELRWSDDDHMKKAKKSKG